MHCSPDKATGDPFPQKTLLSTSWAEGISKHLKTTSCLCLGRYWPRSSTCCARLQTEPDPISRAQLTIRNGATISGAPDTVSISLGAHLDSLTEVYKDALLPICSDGTRLSFPIPARFGELDADTGSPKLPLSQGEIPACMHTPFLSPMPEPNFSSDQQTVMQPTDECLHALMPRHPSCKTT
jgi:hypothetical protein